MGARAARIALALLTTSLAAGAAGNTILLQMFPSTDPDAVLYCAMSFDGRKVSAIAAKGMGLMQPRPYHWWANSREDQAMIDSLAGFLTGQIPSQNPQDLPLLQPPYLTVDWFAKLNGGLASGRYQQPGTTLPPALRHLFITVMPGSACAALAQS